MLTRRWSIIQIVSTAWEGSVVSLVFAALDAGTSGLLRQSQDQSDPSSSSSSFSSLSTSSSNPLHLSPAIWIESLRSTLLFSSAQLLERRAPLWRSSTHRGCCCLGCLRKEARTHRSTQSLYARDDTALPLGPSLPCLTPRTARF